MSRTANTPQPPYYAVVFTSAHSEDVEGYAKTAERMLELARDQPGFLGVESARDEALGITVSYWESLEAVRAWREQVEHRAAQRAGRERWYSEYQIRVCRVERAWEFERP